jgi:hypothetical protein
VKHELRRISMRLFGLWTSVCVVAIILFAASASFASPRLLSYGVEFDRMDLSIDRAGGYENVRIPGALTTIEVGHPELPLKLVRFVVPEGTRAVGASAIVRSQSVLDGPYSVRPRQPEVPLSRPELAAWVDPDGDVYASESPYPAEVCVFLGTGNMSGQTIATVAVHPVQYVPARGQLILNEGIEVTLTLEDTREMDRVPIARSAAAQATLSERLNALVVNPGDAPASPLSGSRSGDVDYLVITDASYVGSFQTLADWKAQKGLTTEVVSTSWIYSNYDGVDDQDKIRNCIIDYYENHGTIWVLLGGDTTKVPARTVWAINTDAGDDNIRCDLYYADIDGTWNDDGDNRYGEVIADNIDMYADLFVGRAPVDTSTEAGRFVNKVLTYEGAPGGASLPTDYQTDMLFLAEVLWDSPWTDGGVCKDMIDTDSAPAQFDPISKLYQTNGQLTRSQTMSRLNAGQNIVNHNGHANYSVMSIGSSGLYNSDMDGLSNGSRYGIWYSIGCWPAAIDYNCIAEHWVNAPNGGGVAFVGNSRFGWGSPGNPGFGTSDLFDREFFNQLFNEGLERIGMTNAAHKDAYVEIARTSGYHRYCLYELNLLGDPEMRIWTNEPVATIANHAVTVPLGEHPFLVAVSREGAPVAGATVFLANGEVRIVETTGENGIAVLLPAPTEEGSLTLTVTGQGILPYSVDVSVVDQPADTDAPAPIDGLTLVDPFDLGSIVELDWSGYVAPSDFAHYKIYRETGHFSDVAGLTPIATDRLVPALTQWTDATAESGQSYYYAITAVDVAGNEATAVECQGPIVASVNSRILLFDADDDDLPFDGTGDDYGVDDGCEAPWVEALDSVGELYTLSRTLPADLTPFDLIIYLGGVLNFGFPEGNISLTDEEAQALTDFVDAGRTLYVEEPNFGKPYYLDGTPTTVELWNRFHATFVFGSPRTDGNVQSLDGQTGTPAAGMSYAYDYQSWPDQFVAKVGSDGSPGGLPLWTDQAGQPRGSLYEDPATGGRRYMVPVLLGGVTDGAYPSTRLEYVTRILDDAGLIGTTGVDETAVGALNRLSQNAPNPFNPSTSISYTVAREGATVTLAVYDVSGRLVRELVNETAEAGPHVARWDGRGADGRAVSSGIYFCRLSVDAWSAARKMVLLK